MRAPAFWQSDGPTARLLAPLGVLYDVAGILRRRFVVPAEVGIPVVCVGNATAGGSGKTPVALDLARRLQLRGVRVHILTRGYKGRLTGPLQVNPLAHTSAEVGDEPLLLARVATTWIARDRAAGARMAAADGAQVVVMDDGLQNPALVKDLSLLVIDGGAGFGNGRVIPAGPLREARNRALARADALAIVGPDTAGVAAMLSDERPILRGDFRVEPMTARRFEGRRVLAFCGIGRPAKFFETLRGLGAEPVETQAFGDHHVYRPSELHGLLTRAGRAGLVPVTTEKDAMRLPDWARARIETLPVEIAWSAPADVDALLDRVVPADTGGSA